MCDIESISCICLALSSSSTVGLDDPGYRMFAFWDRRLVHIENVSCSILVDGIACFMNVRQDGVFLFDGIGCRL